MKTINELKGIVTSWWEYNQTLAQVGEAQYFVEQVWDWESGFKNYTKKDWVKDETPFQILRCKDVKGGLSIHLKSGDSEINGILTMSSGVWVDKVGEGDTETLTFIGARIGQQ